MAINLQTLPPDVYKKIPLSIKTYKKEYEFEELPYDIQNLIREFKPTEKLTYKNKIYEFEPEIFEYGDFKAVDSLVDLVVGYIKNYFHIQLGEYPFNGSVGSKIRNLLQTRDTNLRNLLLSEELNNVSRVFSLGDKDTNVSVVSKGVSKTGFGNYVEYTLSVELKINDIIKDVSVNFIL